MIGQSAESAQWAAQLERWHEVVNTPAPVKHSWQSASETYGWESYGDSCWESWIALLKGMDSLVNASYQAFIDSIWQYADCYSIQLLDGQPEYYTASDSGQAIIDSYWQAYLELHRVLNAYIAYGNRPLFYRKDYWK